MINVLGDALAAGIMAHICRKEFIKDGDEVRTPRARVVTVCCAAAEPASSQLPTFVSKQNVKVFQTEGRIGQWAA